MDERLFGEKQIPALRAAAADLCWLLDRGYASPSATELVGNRYNLASRQRMALLRCVCSEDSVRQRQAAQISLDTVRGKELWIDGYNLLTVIESAMGGGLVLLGRDGCCRDIAGIHRRYRKVNETIPALQLIGRAIAELGISCSRWWLDKPVSNSGRLKTLILEQAQAAGWNMSVDLDFNPDKVLRNCAHVVATSDGAVLEQCRQWANLARHIIAGQIPQAWVLDLTAAQGDECSPTVSV